MSCRRTLLCNNECLFVFGGVARGLIKSVLMSLYISLFQQGLHNCIKTEEVKMFALSECRQCNPHSTPFFRLTSSRRIYWISSFKVYLTSLLVKNKNFSKNKTFPLVPFFQKKKPRQIPIFFFFIFFMLQNCSQIRKQQKGAKKS